MRLDIFITKQTGESRHFVQKMIREEGVFINGQKVFKPSFQMRGAETLQYTLPHKSDPLELKPEKIPFEILYEDEDLAVLNKPVGLVVHPGAGNHSGTLVNGLLHRYKTLPVGDELLKPGIVHRLDKGTSGCLVVARSQEALQNLQRQFKNREVEKIYLALVFGHPKMQGIFDRPLGRHIKKRQKISSHTKKGREAKTEWMVLESFEQCSWVQIRLHTGRTHQIRVHFAEAGFPIVGDLAYGKRKKVFFEGGERPLLHASQISFKHPKTNKPLTFEAPLPKDICDVLRHLRTPC